MKVKKLIMAYRKAGDFTPDNIAYVSMYTIEENSASDQARLYNDVQELIVKDGYAHVIVADVSSEWHRSMMCAWSKYLGKDLMP